MVTERVYLCLRTPIFDRNHVQPTLQAIIDEFEIEDVTGTIEPSYNVAPGQDVAVILKDENRKLGLLKWGLIPSWAKDPAIGNRMINAARRALRRSPASSIRSGENAA
jgi:putative SOS response-associated peptidase YedK